MARIKIIIRGIALRLVNHQDPVRVVNKFREYIKITRRNFCSTLKDYRSMTDFKDHVSRFGRPTAPKFFS
jgi:hypothetical protein